MKRALVVDDERKMRRVLQMLLEHMGLESVAGRERRGGARAASSRRSSTSC